MNDQQPPKSKRLCENVDFNMGCSKVAVKKERFYDEGSFYPYLRVFAGCYPPYLAPPGRLERPTN